jgi:ATP-binding cassette subfamily B protein
MRHSHSSIEDTTEISWRTLQALLPYLLEFKVRISSAIICLIGAKLASVALPFLLKYTVDGLAQSNEADHWYLAPIALIIAYGGFRLLTVILGEVRDTLFGRVTERAMRRLGLTVFKHLHALDLEFHLGRQTGGLSRDIERGVSGISFLLRFMVFNIIPTLLEIALVLGIFIYSYNIWFAMTLAIAIVAYVAWTVKATEWRTRYVRAANEADSKTNSAAIDSLLNYETVKYFNNETYEAERYDQQLAEWEQARRKNRLTLFALNGGQALIIAVAMTAMLLLAAQQVMQQQMTLGDFVLVNAFMMQIFMPLNFLGFVYREMKGSMANIERMFQLLREQPRITNKANALELKVSQGRIDFIDVGFHYHPDRPILNRLNFTIFPGQKVAFVGSSGSGKSTLTKLLYRFYDPECGTIEIDGQPIDQVTLQSLRRAIGIVPQDTVLFNTTIGENIRYGDPTATEQDLWHAIEQAYLKEFIEGLPNGLATLVGERGLKLSGGDKQRVAIARTLLKKTAILIFDEATSSLDSHSEDFILQAIERASRGHTTIMIAHRLSTVVDADTIFVLHQGKIVEQGNHQQLLNNNSYYARLWYTQQKEKSETT